MCRRDEGREKRGETESGSAGERGRVEGYGGEGGRRREGGRGRERRKILLAQKGEGECLRQVIPGNSH